MAVALFDTASTLAPLRDELRAAIDRVLDSERFILGPEVAAFEQELAALHGRGARRRRGQRHRRDHDRAARDGRRPGRRGGRAVVHLLRLGRGDPADGRHAGLLRHRPGDVLRHRRHGARGADAAHEGRDRRAPVRQRRAGAPRSRRWACRCSRTPRRPSARTRRHGRAGRAGHGRDALLLPLEEPRLLRRRRDDPHLRRAASPSRRASCAFTARATRSTTSSSATTRAWTSCRRRSCACSCHISTPGRPAAARRRATTRRRGSASWWRCPSRSPGRRRPGICTSCAHPQVERLQEALAARASASSPTTARPVHRQPPMRRWGDGVELPGDRAGRAQHLAIPMSPVLTRAQADEVVAAGA